MRRSVQWFFLKTESSAFVYFFSLNFEDWINQSQLFNTNEWFSLYRCQFAWFHTYHSWERLLQAAIYKLDLRPHLHVKGKGRKYMSCMHSSVIFSPCLAAFSRMPHTIKETLESFPRRRRWRKEKRKEKINFERVAGSSSAIKGKLDCNLALFL